MAHLVWAPAEVWFQVCSLCLSSFWTSALAVRDSHHVWRQQHKRTSPTTQVQCRYLFRSYFLTWLCRKLNISEVGMYSLFMGVRDGRGTDYLQNDHLFYLQSLCIFCPSEFINIESTGGMTLLIGSQPSCHGGHTLSFHLTAVALILCSRGYMTIFLFFAIICPYQP